MRATLRLKLSVAFLKSSGFVCLGAGMKPRPLCSRDFCVSENW